jgi:hypothetical protein
VFIGGFALNSSVNLNMSFTADLQGATTPVTGVFLQGGNVGSGTKINIFQGTFSIHAFSGRGIEIRDAFPADSEIHIFGNNFNCSGGGASMSGLWSENGTMNNLNIYGNHFSPFPGESTCEGIRLIGAFNGSGNYVGDNTFNTIDGGFMDVNWMQGFTICSNSVQALGASSGFRFYDTNLDVDFTGNKIYATGEAVKISGLLGTQFHMGNEWHPVEYYAPCPTSPGLCLWTARSVVHASSPLGMASLNKFTVHTAQSVWNDATDEYDFFSPFYPENIAPSDPVFGFFETQSGSPASGCSSQFGPGGGSELDVRIADGSFQAPPESPSMDWITKSYLYKKLKDNPEMIGQYPSFSTFLSTHEATNIGEFYEVNKKVGEAFSASAPLLAESQQVMGAIDSLVLLLEGTDSLLEVAQSENEIDSLAQIKVGHLLQLSSNQSRYDSLHNAYKLERDATLSNALTLNNAITPTTQVESNEKKVLDIMIRTISVQDGALTEGQKNELLSIAQQCAETGGIAVLRALAMLPVTDRHQITPCIPVAVDTIAPLLSSAPTGQNLMAGNHSNVHSWLYPNPATASFFVDLPEKGRIEVIDMMGRSALVRDFQNEGSPVEIGHSLPSGMYIVNISTVSGKSFSEKLLIHND